MKQLLLVVIMGVFLAACEKAQEQTVSQSVTNSIASVSKSMPRWYTRKQVERGNTLFQENCAVCHKPDASGTKDWQELDANGKLPPPPLNGTAHTWHHSMAILHRAVREGGIPLGGTMPPFKDKLNKKDIDDILAWVMSHWSDKVYGIWYQRQQQQHSRKAS